MNRWLVALLLAGVLTASNFFYQAVLGPGDWSAAAERSFFQAVACLIFAMNIGLVNK